VDTHHLRFRVAFFLVAAIVLAMVVTLPFAVRSLFEELFSSVEGDVFSVVGNQNASVERMRNDVHIGIVDLDESH